MAFNINYKHISPRALLGTGAASTKQVSASPGGALAKLKSVFGGTGTPSRPKVVSGGHNKADLVLRRTGPSRPLDLSRLHRAPPGKSYLAAPTTAPTGGNQPANARIANGAPAPQQAPPAAPPAPPARGLDDRIDDLQEALASAKTATLDIADLRHEVAGERREGNWAAKRAQLVDRQQTAAAGIDKALGTVAGLLTEHAADPNAVGMLRSLQTLLAEQAVAVHFSGVAETAALPVPRDALPHLRAAAASLRPDDAALLETMADELGGALRLARRDGDPEALRSLARKVDSLLANLSACKTPGGGRADETPEGGKAADAFRHLAAVVRTKAALAEAVEHLAKASSGTPPLPVGAALRAMGSGLPSLRHWGNSPVPAHNSNAAESLNALAETLAGGEVPDMLLGRDPAFDAAALALKTRWAEDRAERHLTETHASRNSPAPTGEEIASARANARLAATGRHELTAANRKLEGLLKTDRQVWHQPSTWGDKGLVFGQGTASSVRKDAQFMAALRTKGGKDAGRDVALLMARISDLELKTLTLEKNVLGLHPKLDLAALAPRADDPRGPLAHLGVDRGDLERMGLTTTDVAQLEKQVVALAGQGLRSADEVREVTAALNTAVSHVMRNSLAQGAMNDQAGAKIETAARRLASDIFQDVAGAHGDQTLKPNDQAVVDGFNRQMVAAYEMVLKDGGLEAMSELADGAEAYRAAEHGIAGQLQAHKDVDARVEVYKEVLADARDRLGIDVDPHKPKGLESAKALLQALDAHDALLADPADQGAKARLDRALGELKGFDADGLRRPWHGKLSAFFGRAERPSVDDLAKYRLAAEAIVYVREGAAQDKALIRGQIEQQGKVMDDLLAARRDAQPFVMEAARRTIRAAVLANWPAPARGVEADGRVTSYNPAAKRAEIEGLLHTWGLNTDLFAPEIDEALYGTLGKEDVAAWRAETRYSPEGEAALAARGDKGLGVLVSRQGMDEATRRNLLATLGTLQGGERLGIRVGERVTLDSGKIPVDPTGTFGVKARVAGAGLAAFEVEARADGYTLTLKAGLEGKVGADAVAGRGAGPFVKLEATAGAEGTYSRLAGATLHFPATPEGRDQLVAVVQRMTRGETLDAGAWAEARQAYGATERAGRGQLNVGGVARAEYTGLAGQGVGASASIAASFQVADKTAEFANLNERVREDETEVTGAVGANVALYAKLYNAVNTGTGYASQADKFQQAANSQLGTTTGDKPLYDVSSPTGNQDIAGVGVGASISYIKRDRQVTDADGFYTKREITKLTNVKVSPLSTISTIGSDGLREAAEKNADFRRDLGALMGHMRANDFVVVGYSLDAGKLQQANALLDQARAIRRDGGGANAGRAAALEAQARSIAEDEANFVPTKVSLVPVEATKEEIGNINARFLRWDSFSDGKFAHPAIVLTLPSPAG